MATTTKFQLATSRPIKLSLSLLLVFILVTATQSRQYNSGSIANFGLHAKTFGYAPQVSSRAIAEALRGGATEEEDEDEEEDADDEDDEGDEVAVEEAEEEEEDEYDDEDEDEYDVEEEDEYDDEEEEDEEENAVADASESEYDEPYFMSPSMQLYTTLGAMMLGSRVDLFTPAVVRLVR